MMKKRKSIFLIGFFACFFFLAFFFGKTVFLGLTHQLFKGAVHFFLEAEIRDAGFEYQKGSFVFHDLEMLQRGQKTLQIKKLNIFFSWENFEKKVCLHLFLKEPHFFTPEKGEFFQKQLSSAFKNRFVQLDFSVEEGKISFLEKNHGIKKTIQFSFCKESGTEKWRFYSEKDPMDIQLQKSSTQDSLVHLTIEKGDCDSFYKLCSLFYPKIQEIFQNPRGSFEGKIVARMSGENWIPLEGKLSFSQFTFSMENALCFAETFQIDMQSLISKRQTVEKNENVLIKPELPWMKELQVDVSLTRGKLFYRGEKGPIFEMNLKEGFFSFYPQLGAKISVQGMVTSSGGKIPFQISGKCFLKSRVSNWGEVFLKFSEKKKSFVSFQIQQLESGYESFLRTEGVESAEIKVLKQVFEPFFPRLEEIHFYEGSLNTSMKWLTRKGKIEKWEIFDFQGFHWNLIYRKAKLFLSQLRGKGSFSFLEGKECESEGELEIMGGQGDFFLAQPLSLSNVQGKVFLRKGIWEKDSSFKGFLNQIESVFHIRGKFLEPKVHLGFRGSLGEFLLCYFDPLELEKGTDIQREVRADFFVKKQEKAFQVRGAFKGSAQELVTFSFPIKFLEKNGSVFSLQSLSIPEGGEAWVNGKNIFLDLWPLKNPSWSFSGEGSFALSLRGSLWNLQAFGKDFTVHTPFVDLFVKEVPCDKGAFQASYDFKKHSYEAKLPVFDGFVSSLGDKASPDKVKVQIEKASVWIKDGQVELRFPEAKCFQSKGSGRIWAKFSDAKKVLWGVELDSWTGNLDDVFFQKFLSFRAEEKGKKLFSLKGDIAGKGNFLFQEKKLLQWAGEFQCKNVSFVTDLVDGVDFSGFLRGDREKDLLEIGDLQGTLHCHIFPVTQTYFLSVPFLCKKSKNSWDFDFRLGSPTFDVLRLLGSAKKEGEKLKFSLDGDKSSFLGKKPQIHRCCFDLQSGHFDELDIFCPIASSFWREWIELYLQKEFLGEKFFPKSVLLSGERDILSHLYVDAKKQFCFHAISKEPSGGKNGLEILGRKNRESFTIQKWKIADWEGKFSFKPEKGRWKIFNCEIRKGPRFFVALDGFYQESLKRFDGEVKEAFFDLKKRVFFKEVPVPIQGILEGKGCFSLNLKDAQWEINGDVHLKNFTVGKEMVSNRVPLNFQFSSKNGLRLGGLDMNFSLFQIPVHLDVKHLRYQNAQEKLLCQGFHVQIPSQGFLKIFKTLDRSLQEPLCSLWKVLRFEKDLDLQGDFFWNRKDFFLSLSIPETHLEAIGASRHLRNFSFTMDPKQCRVQFRVMGQGNTYVFSHEILLSDAMEGKLWITEESPCDNPLHIDWKWDLRNFSIQKIQGNLCGTEWNFYAEHSGKEKSFNHLLGSVKVDFSSASKLFPEKMKNFLDRFQIGKGYEFQGKVSLDGEEIQAIKGFVSGKQYTCFGYQFRNLWGKVFYDRTHFELSDLKLSDLSGGLQIPRVLFEKKGDYQWDFAIPLIELQEFRPSFLRKEHESDPVDIKPLIVRNLKLEKIQGNLKDVKSITGKVSAEFINSFKRDSTMLDAPADVLSRIVGIDLELLVPVKGSLWGEIREGKFYLTQMKDVYSEGKRSKFFLSEPCFIDFDGNMDINLKMKQYVLFKFTEHFVLSLKGGVGHPEIHLEKKKKLISHFIPHGYPFTASPKKF